jgi:peptide deformylase
MNESEKETEAPPAPPLIITHFDLRFPVLEQKSLPCDIPLNPEDAAIVTRMKEELVKLGDNAVGLAGVQIGIARSVFVMKRNDGSIIECVNPRIVSRSHEQSRKPEGCLSLPNVMAVIGRPKSLVLHYYDTLGTDYTTEFHGMEAKIVCHEMDHLNGSIITGHLEQQMEKNRRLLSERHEAKKRSKNKRRRLAKIHKRMNRRK